ncbi:HlyD family efflux transporter periplasmic adaptor subunit [Thermaurantiacus sp.]
MQRKIFPALVGLLLLLAGAGAAWWFLEGRHVRSTDNAYLEADMAVIAPKIAGYVVEVAVTDNQAVRKGDLLVRIDDSDFRAAYARADAEVERVRLATGAAKATVEAVRSSIVESEAELRAAQAEVLRARADLDRAEELLKRGFATRALIDERRAALSTAEARMSERRAGIAAAEANRTAASGTAESESAALKAAVAQREAAALDLANTALRSPIDGVVGNRSARVGQYARVGQQLMVVVPVEQAYLVANFKETQISGMVAGQPVVIRLDSYPDTPLRGRIVSFSPASGSRFSVIPPENATGNFTRVVQRLPVRIEIERPLPQGVRLVPGLSARVSVDMRDRPS